MGICGSTMNIPPEVDCDTENAVHLIERQESKILDARVRHFKATELWKCYKGTLSIVGHGQSGEVRVVRRRNSRCKKLFALKSVDKKAVDPSRMPNFVEEVNIMKQLDHPNIAKLYETYEDADTLYMILGLCEGGELFDALARAKKFSEAKASLLVKQMLSAVLYCHSKGITHRDLKLENFVFRDRDGPGKEVLQLIDFGLSKRHCLRHKRMSMIVGSAYYCAPEVLTGNYTNACDIWSVGVIAFMLITGAPPFHGSDIVTVVEQAKHQKEVKFEPFKVSKIGKEFIRGLLDIDPQTRWTAEQALAHAWLNPMKRRNSKEQLDAFKKSSGNFNRAVVTSSPLKPVNVPSFINETSSKRIADRIRRFASYSRVKKLALLLNVSNISSNEERELGQLFRAMDTNMTGRLFNDELERGFREAGIVLEHFDGVFSGLDQDGSGRIQYSQFLAAASESCDLNDAEIRGIFKEIFDVDGDGKVSCSDMKKVLGPSFSEAYIENIIAEVDLASDGRISLDEFIATMSSRGDEKRPAASVKGESSKSHETPL